MFWFCFFRANNFFFAHLFVGSFSFFAGSCSCAIFGVETQRPQNEYCQLQVLWCVYMKTLFRLAWMRTVLFSTNHMVFILVDFPFFSHGYLVILPSVDSARNKFNRLNLFCSSLISANYQENRNNTIQLISDKCVKINLKKSSSVYSVILIPIHLGLIFHTFVISCTFF